MESAIKEHDRIAYQEFANYITIYTDGSGIGGRIDASAVRMMSLQDGFSVPVTTLGLDTQFTVYFGELYGLFLALEILEEPTEYADARPVIIYTDNQAAIRHAHCPQSRSG